MTHHSGSPYLFRGRFVVPLSVTTPFMEANYYFAPKVRERNALAREDSYKSYVVKSLSESDFTLKKQKIRANI